MRSGKIGMSSSSSPARDRARDGLGDAVGLEHVHLPDEEEQEDAREDDHVEVVEPQDGSRVRPAAHDQELYEARQGLRQRAPSSRSPRRSPTWRRPSRGGGSP